MQKVEIIRLGAKHNGEDLGAVGEVIEVDDRQAKALVTFALAKIVPHECAPADADDETAEGSDDDAATDEDETTTTDADETVTAAQVREWAKANDVEVPARGAIPASVREAYDAAHADD